MKHAIQQVRAVKTHNEALELIRTWSKREVKLVVGEADGSPAYAVSDEDGNVLALGWDAQTLLMCFLFDLREEWGWKVTDEGIRASDQFDAWMGGWGK